MLYKVLNPSYIRFDDVCYLTDLTFYLNKTEENNNLTPWPQKLNRNLNMKS